MADRTVHYRMLDARPKSNCGKKNYYIINDGEYLSIDPRYIFMTKSGNLFTKISEATF